MEVDPDNPRPNEFLAKHPYSWGYAGWVSSGERMLELRRYCDLRESPVLAILEAGVPPTGQYVSGETLMWPEPAAWGEKPSVPTKRMARLILLQPSSLTTLQQTLPT